MKKFTYLRAESYEEASELLEGGGATRAERIAAALKGGSPKAVTADDGAQGAAALAGGTDLLGRLKDGLLDSPPAVLIDLKRIPESAGITREPDGFLIGANTTLTALAEHVALAAELPALAQAARSVATPLIRNIATLGGNLCQDVRCWFYRYPHEAGGRLDCKRKGGELCYAILGDNRYHSIFGGLRCGANSCTQGCPAATAIPDYMEQLRQGKVEEAVRILFAVNPLPAVTGRVCAHRCQSDCNKGEVGESVAIRNVERSLGDYALKHPELFYVSAAAQSGKKVAIVGSGPAGLSAAYYARRQGHAVTVYEEKPQAGGMLRYAIPAYRLPKGLVDRLVAALEGMGIVFVCDTQVGRDVAAAELEAGFDAVYFATGTWKRPVLGLSGEELTVFGLDFLVQVHDWMNGKVGSEVLVAGGGNVAMDVAITAKRLGARRVVLAALETEDIMPAGSEEIARAREEGVELMGGWGLARVLSEDGAVRGMELKRCLTVYDEAGRFTPVYDEADTRVVSAENILMAVGQNVDLNFLDERYQLELTARGLIDVADESQMTSRPGVFAGGDVTTGPSTVIECIANGHVAARGIERYLGAAPVGAEGAVSAAAAGVAPPGVPSPPPFLTFDPLGVVEPAGLKLAERAVAERTIDDEDEYPPTLEDALKEATRCMNCGCYAVEPSDLAPVLVALGATVVTTARELSAREFCCSELKAADVLAPGELIRAVRVPAHEGAVCAYDKFRLRDAVDFALYALASVLVLEEGVCTEAHLVLGGVAAFPVVCRAAEEFCVGKPLNAEVAAQAAELALADSWSLGHNEYKIIGLKALVRDALMRAGKR